MRLKTVRTTLNESQKAWLAHLGIPSITARPLEREVKIMAFKDGLLKVLQVAGTVASAAVKYYPPAAAIKEALTTVVGIAESVIPGEGKGSERLPVAKERFYDMQSLSSMKNLMERKGYKMSIRDEKVEAAIKAEVALNNAIGDLIENGIVIEKA